jgi:hypothetical protein
MPIKYPVAVVMGCLLSGAAMSGTVIPAVPTYILPEALTYSDTPVVRQGLLQVHGTLLSSPCSGGEVQSSAPASQGRRTVIVVLDGCGEGINGSGAFLPTTIAGFTPGTEAFKSAPKFQRLRHGANRLPVTVRADSRLLRVEVNYE